MKLLIVDDDVSAVDVIRSTMDLQALGFSRVLEAYNGVKAKELILQEQVDVILCDIEMPLCNGMELLRWLREEGFQAQFVFLTCFDKFEYAQDSIEYGVSAYITKPIDFQKLRRALGRAAQAQQKKRQDQESENHKLSMLHSSSELIREMLLLLSQTDGSVAAASPENTGSRYYALAVASDRSGKAGEVKDVLNQVLHRAPNSNSYLQYETEGLYIHLTVLNASMRQSDQLFACCREAVCLCAQRYGIALHCVLSEPQYIAYLPALKSRLERYLLEAGPWEDVCWLPPDVGENRSVQAKTVRNAREYIDQHFRSEISRSELAGYAFVSPNYLSKLFVQEVGMSIREYTNSRRVEEAKRLLLQSARTISDIGSEVGFDSASYFSTVFCKHTGMSPVAWRNKFIQK